MIATGPEGGAEREKTLHRIEAFSDIVIGFCIAEMGINLLVPQHPSEYRAIWTSVAGFAVSFFLISVVWFVHQRIFRTFFVLTPLTLVLNFTLLGSLVLMVYAQQLVLHFIASGSPVAALLRIWMASYGVVYGLLDSMLCIGLRARWRTLLDADLRWGLTRASMLSTGTLMFFLAGAGATKFHGGLVLIAGSLAVFSLRFAVPTLVNRILAARSSAVAR